MSKWQKPSEQVNIKKGSALDQLFKNLSQVLDSLEKEKSRLESARDQAEMEAEKIRLQSKDRSRNGGE